MTHSCTFTPTVDTLGGRAALESRNTERRVVLPRPYKHNNDYENAMYCEMCVSTILQCTCTCTCI